MKNILFVAFLAAFAWYSNGALKSLSPQERSSLSIHTSNDSHKFDIELAETFEQKQKGLMHRKHLDEMSGMLFLRSEPSVIDMWMKNTFIPLDMIFIDEEGVIRKIHQNAEPHSLESISSETEVVAVLELNGGLTQKLTINVGDKVSYDNKFTP